MEEPHAGDLLTPKIRLVRPLGAGGMGSVWVADHLALHTQVVVKFMATNLTFNKDAIARFEREAAAASQVKSPHVVQILDYGVSEPGVPFIVMELLEGHDLALHLEKFGRLDLAQVGEIVAQLCRALARAHERGIVHRDIKPQNIFLCDAGSGELFVKLLDFGIAKGASVQKLDESTKTGTMVGSPYYMSPEQLVGAKDIDYHTDLWSTGVVAFEAMTGTRAFEGETVGALALLIHNEPLPIPSKRCDAASPAVDAWFARACGRAPRDRFRSAKEMADAFIAALGGDASKSVMTASGAALAISGDDPMTLLKTAAQARGDARVATDAGLASPAARIRTSRGVAIALVLLVVFSVGTFATMRLVHHRDKPAQASETAITTTKPAASGGALPREAEQEKPRVEAMTVTSSPTKVLAPVVKGVPHASASAAVVPIVSASSAPPPTHPTGRTGNEDDIK